MKNLFRMLLFLLLAGCTATGIDIDSRTSAARREIVTALAKQGSIPAGSRQLLLVSPTEHPAAAVVFAFAETGGEWRAALPPMRGTVGRAGFAPSGEKREGDGRTPSGIFPLVRAFGYLPDAPIRLAYRQVTPEDVWVDDPAAPDYNRWVRREETSAASFEVLRREDDQYKYGVVIEYNTAPVVPGLGSAIFLHLWRSEGVPTAGCVALAEADVLRLLGWLDPQQQPVIVLGAGRR